MTKGERRKQDLLKIAYEMFSKIGYENTSVDMIIEKAGIAKGTYYYYFESKEQTLEEVIGMILDAETEKALELKKADLPAPKKLVAIIACFKPDVSESSMVDALNKPENLLMHERFNEKLMDRIVPLISDVTYQGIEEGLFACADVPERVRMMIILANKVFDEKGYTDKDVKVFIDIVEKILCAKPGTMAFLKEVIKTDEEK
ncbi:MAG: TetR/AcrR family transcriptional regulator [Lachnospiraceae bacterium]|nr:TetR/AcrR family transcriptional regulator [Lachnospiraceae bacterium]